MAQFQLAFENTMRFEDSVPSGKVTIEPDGGRARFGINEHAHQMPESFWTGPADEQILVARQIYLDDYWTPIRGDQIKSQAIANKLFDMVVNMGVGEGVKLCQESLNHLLVRADSGPIAVDGGMGPQTLVAINDEYDGALVLWLRAKSAAFYKDLCRRKPNHMPSLEGYLRRAAA